MTTAPNPAPATHPATVTLRGPIRRSLTSNTASRHLPLSHRQADLVPPRPHPQIREEQLLKEPISTMTHSPSSAAASVRLLRQVVPSMTMSSLAAVLHARRQKYIMMMKRQRLRRMHSLTLQTSWTTWQKTQVAVTVVSTTAPQPPTSQRDWTISSCQMG